jgi:mannosylglycerate hydrolase
LETKEKPVAKKTKQKGYLVTHTHWDREWRDPIWKHRSGLVEVLDELLAALDTDPKYRSFMCDGQGVMIADYLQIRPQMREKIAGYVAARRIVVGPWFTLPDMFPVDGEALVRNLLKGIRFADSLGNHLSIGYTSFGWGQTAQLPQIYAGFGMDFAIPAKRITKLRAPASEFIWQAPDGTQLLASRLGTTLRHNFFFNGYLQIVHGIRYGYGRWAFDLSNAGVIYHRSDPERSDREYYRVAHKYGYHTELLKQAVEAGWNDTNDTLVKDHRLLMSGCDFSTSLPLITRIIDDANQLFDDREFVHATLEEYVAVLKEKIDRSKLKVIVGELREGPPVNTSGNALATRSPIKRMNRKAQNLLIHAAEPLAVMSAVLTQSEYPTAMLDIAWDYLMKAQPHDSINAVTQDKTADDVMHRLCQTVDIADVVVDDAAGQIIKAIDLRGYDPKDTLLAVFNTTGRARGGVIEITLDTPRDQNIWDFTLADAQGKPVAVQPVSVYEKNAVLFDPEARPWPVYVDRHRAYAELPEIPAGGYAVYKVVPKTTFLRQTGVDFPPARKSTGETLLKSPLVLENEFLRVQMNANGSFDLHDKATGRQFKDMNYFEDSGDRGDYWSFIPPFDDRIFTTRSAPARTWVADNGPLAATLAAEIKIMLPAYTHKPAHLSEREVRRSTEEKEITITTFVTLRRGARRVDIKTVIDNTIEDHRMRVMFPTHVQADYASAAGHFTVDRRPVTPVKDATGEYWPEMQTLPMQSFVDVSDAKSGVALLTNCIGEYEAMPDEERTVALTLFRSTRNMMLGGLDMWADFPDQKGGQSLGRHTFQYTVYPHAGNWDTGGVYAQAVDFNVPLIPMQTARHEFGHLPPAGGLFELKSDKFVVSCFKKCEDRETYILRGFNPSTRADRGFVHFSAPVKGAWLANLNEERGKPLEVVGGHDVKIHVPSNRIYTIEVEFAPLPPRPAKRARPRAGRK